MVTYYPLDKTIIVGEKYEMSKARFFVVQAIGTNATSAIKLVIDGIPVGEIVNEVAPIRPTSSNCLGPLKLGELYYVVPPERKYWCEGPSGAKMRLVGVIGELAPGEVMPLAYATRFEAQGKHYLKYVSDSYSVGTDVTWVADAEYKVLELTPAGIETYKFNNIAMASISGDTVSEGDFSIRHYLDGKPLDILTKNVARPGIEVLSMPKPPTPTAGYEAFSLAGQPIEVKGDHTIKVVARNVSGANKAPATGASWTIAVTYVVEYIME